MLSIHPMTSWSLIMMICCIVLPCALKKGASEYFMIFLLTTLVVVDSTSQMKKCQLQNKLQSSVIKTQLTGRSYSKRLETWLGQLVCRINMMATGPILVQPYYILDVLSYFIWLIVLHNLNSFAPSSLYLFRNMSVLDDQSPTREVAQSVDLSRFISNTNSISTYPG